MKLHLGQVFEFRVSVPIGTDVSISFLAKLLNGDRANRQEGSSRYVLGYARTGVQSLEDTEYLVFWQWEIPSLVDVEEESPLRKGEPSVSSDIFRP